MKIFTYWTCKEFGHFLSSFPKRVKKIKSSKPYKSRKNKNCTFSSDEEFEAALEEVLNDEIGSFGSKEEMALVAIIDYNFDKVIDMKTNRENVEIFVETNNDLQNETHTMEQRSKPKIRVEMSTPNINLIRNYPPKQIIGSKEK